MPGPRSLPGASQPCLGLSGNVKQLNDWVEKKRGWWKVWAFVGELGQGGPRLCASSVTLNIEGNQEFKAQLKKRRQRNQDRKTVERSRSYPATNCSSVGGHGSLKWEQDHQDQTKTYRFFKNHENLQAYFIKKCPKSSRSATIKHYH